MKWPFVRRSKYEILMSDYKFIGHELDILTKETNRLNQELAIEKNNHREIKEKLKEKQLLIKKWKAKYFNVKNKLLELKETKEHEQKLFQEYDKLNQQNMSILFELQEIKDKNNQLLLDKQHLKNKIKEIESEFSKLKVRYTETKSQNDWLYCNYRLFKEQIEKSGYLKK